MAEPDLATQEGVGGEWSVGDMSLSELVIRRDTSARLRHAMLSRGGEVEIRTVRDYLEAGDVAPVILMRETRNLGRKTADELDGLVKGIASDWNTATGTFQGEDAAGRAGLHDDDARPSATALAAAFGSSTLLTVLERDFMSVRLARALREPGIGERTFVSAAIGAKDLRNDMMRVRSVGRLSVDELANLIARHVEERIPSDCDASRHPTPEGAAIVSSSAEAAASFATVEACDPAALLGTVMISLSPREIEVLERRHGIGREKSETLEEVGAAFGFTRERARQIEAHGLKRIRIKLRASTLAAVLAKRRGAIWDSFGTSSLTDDMLPALRRSLDPHVALALSVLDLKLEDWFDETSLRLANGWFRDRVGGGGIDALAARLKDFAERWPQPRVFPPEDGEPELRDAAVKLVLGWHLEAGYLTKRRPGPRLSRAIHLHALLAGYASPSELSGLLDEYKRRRPSDRCSHRDARIVMEAAPHLFLEVLEDRWYALGSGGSAEQPGLSAVEVARDAPNDQEESLASVTVDVLHRLGPSRFIDLREAVTAVLPAGRSINSIGPTLVTRRETFARPLPGIYALHDQVPDDDAILKDAVPYLLSETQARLLALGRHAGEPWRAFPLWRPATEYRLCRWARFNAASGTFGSLLAAASIVDWPVGDDEKKEWLSLASTSARFSLHFPLKASAHVRPELDRVLAACVHVQDTGSLNWMAANRIQRNRIDSASGTALLSVLVAADALAPGETRTCAWQCPHAKGSQLDQLCEELASELHDVGVLRWDGSAGSHLKARVERRLREPVGWLLSDEVVAMLHAPADGGEADASEEGDGIEMVMAERRRRSEAERREETLRWLLAG